jgi:TPR repeat protein
MKYPFYHVVSILFYIMSVFVFAETDSLDAIKKLAEQGDMSAQFKLGVTYYRGKGVSKDYSEALKWFRKSAEQGLPEAQYNLGVMFYEGKGVPQDYIKAYVWMSLAHSNGYELARKNILILNKTMTAADMEKAAMEAAKIRESLKK